MPISMVVKPPLQSQCQKLPIKGCGELVDGALLYAQGDKRDAIGKLNEAKRINAPADLQRFSTALRDASALPGVGEFAKPLNEVADLLEVKNPPVMSVVVAATVVAQTAADTAEDDWAVRQSSAATRVERHGDPSTRASSASSDLNRIVTETRDLSSPDGQTRCTVFGVDAFCFKGREGPLIVTDVVGPLACTDRVFIGATKGDVPAFGFHWLLESRPTAVTGTRLVIHGGEWLQFVIVPGKKGVSEGRECQLTWSGFRPWIVPGL